VEVPKIRFVDLAAILLGVAFIAYLLVLSSMLAFSFAQQAYLELRAEVIPRYILTLAQAIAGCIAGIIAWRLARRAKLVKPAVILAGLVLVACFALPLWTGRVYWGELPRYQRWAFFWDQRDLALQGARGANQMEVHVVQIDHIIPRVGDLSPQSDGWYNQCAAIYYRLEAISADLPGWDE
jgi:hypothetical protein